MKSLKLLLLLIILNIGSAYATLEITVVKKDENTFPIAVSPFKLIGKDLASKNIAKIIHDNLERSGRFNVFVPNTTVDKFNAQRWKNKNIEALIIGSIEKEDTELYKLSVSLFDVYSNTQLFTRTTHVHSNSFRKVAHQISDDVYEALLGENGSFNTLLTYITITKNSKGEKIYQLNISDADTMNSKSRITLKTPILSPVWSPDKHYKNKKIAYVAFKNGRPRVFIWHPYLHKKIIQLPRFDGIVSSPSWHPNGKSLVMTMSMKGNKDIYSYNLENKRFTRLTSHKGIDTEASYSPDGKRLVFTSDRSGEVQIYIKNLEKNSISRATFLGNYNAKAVFSPDGEHLALVHRMDLDYRIAMLNIKKDELSIMSNGSLDESPHFSPNGDMIIFSNNDKGKGVLSVISVNGNRSYKLSSYNAEVREPNWSGYLK